MCRIKQIVIHIYYIKIIIIFCNRRLICCNQHISRVSVKASVRVKVKVKVNAITSANAIAITSASARTRLRLFDL